MLFVHGYPFDRSIWSHQIAALDGYRRIAPDLRGMGASDAPDLGYSMEIYAADLAALLDVLGVDEVVLCGLSMGGYIAFEFLRRWRDPGPRPGAHGHPGRSRHGGGRKARDAAAALARERGAEAVAESLLPRVLGRSTRTGARSPPSGSAAMMASTPVAGLVGALAAMRDRPDSSPLLPELAGLPTLVMVGEEDELTPPDTARAMADRIPGARLVIVHGSGHLPPVERPVETTRALVEFLRSLR